MPPSAAATSAFVGVCTTHYKVPAVVFLTFYQQTILALPMHYMARVGHSVGRLLGRGDDVVWASHQMPLWREQRTKDQCGCCCFNLHVVGHHVTIFILR